MVKKAWFHLDGDNVYFRGFDCGKEFDGYAVPLFDLGSALTVANYLSTERRRIEYEIKDDCFYIIRGGKKTPMAFLEVNSGDKTFFLYEFGGWQWIKE